MKVRSGFVSNSSTSSFICNFIGVPAKKIIKRKKGTVLINGQVVEKDENVFDEDRELIIDDFFNEHKINLAAVGDSIGWVLTNHNDYVSYGGYECPGTTSNLGDFVKIQKQWQKAIEEFKKIGYEGSLKMYMYSQIDVG